MEAWLGLIGMYNHHPTLFDGFKIPAVLDRDVLIENLMVELTEFELVYNNPNVLQEIIRMWSNKECPIWDKLYETTQFDYNPIHNYDRHEMWNDRTDHDYTRTTERENSATGKVSGTETNTTDSTGNSTGESTNDSTSKETNSGNDNQAHNVTGFNSSTPTASTTDTTTYGKIVDGTGHVAATDKVDTTGKIQYNGDIGQNTENDATMEGMDTDSGTKEDKHDAYMYGNIGVTTTQQMIEQEREIVKFNVMNYIITEFKQRFCILVY